MVWTGKDLKKWGEGKSLLDLGGGSTRGATPSFPALLFTLSHFFLLDEHKITYCPMQGGIAHVSTTTHYSQ